MAECWSLTAEISKNVVSCFSICFILKLSLPFFFRGTSWQSFLFLSFSLDDQHYCHHKWLYECMWHYDILIVWHRLEPCYWASPSLILSFTNDDSLVIPYSLYDLKEEFQSISQDLTICLLIYIHESSERSKRWESWNHKGTKCCKASSRSPSCQIPLAFFLCSISSRVAQ